MAAAERFAWGGNGTPTHELGQLPEIGASRTCGQKNWLQVRDPQIVSLSLTVSNGLRTNVGPKLGRLVSARPASGRGEELGSQSQPHLCS